MIQDTGWGWGPASNGKTLFAGSAGPCGWFSGERPFVSGDGSAVRGERCQRGEVDAALARDRQRGGQADGRLEAVLLTREREWLLARLAEKPDLTLRTVVAELAERGTPASYGAVWRFFKCEGITFKKKPARQRARSDHLRRALGQFANTPLGEAAVKQNRKPHRAACRSRSSPIHRSRRPMQQVQAALAGLGVVTDHRQSIGWRHIPTRRDVRGGLIRRN